MLEAAACGGDDSQSPGDQERAGRRPAASDGTLSAIAGALPGLLSGRLERRPRGLRPWLRLGRRAARDSRRRRRGPADRADRERRWGTRYATTSYRANGLVADQAVDDVAQLVEEVRGRFTPDPSRSSWSASRRAAWSPPSRRAARRPVRRRRSRPAARSATSRARSTTSAISACCSTTSFPGVIPGGPVDVPDTVRAQWTSIYVPAVTAALQADARPRSSSWPSPARRTIRPTCRPPARPSLERPLVRRLRAARRPGPSRRPAVRQHRSRVSRLVRRRRAQRRRRAGEPRIRRARGASARSRPRARSRFPPATLHTTGDPIVPVGQEDALRAARSAASGGLGPARAAGTVDRYGHCTFTGPEVLQAFDAVIARAAAARRVD